MSSNESEKLPMPSSLQAIVGALLFAADHPLTAEEIRTCLHAIAPAPDETDEVLALYASATPREVQDALAGIRKELERTGLGFDLVELNGAFRFQTAAPCGRWVRALLKMDRPNRLSHPALETLAIIAYRQPISKTEIEAIRGVTVDYIVKSLIELSLIRIVGRSELPGRPFLYGTTSTFLDHFGLGSLKELNEIDPTLQRSLPSERKAVHTRKVKSAPREETLFDAPGAPTTDKVEIATDTPVSEEGGIAVTVSGETEDEQSGELS